MAKLYPPVIEGTIPAFYGTTLVVPFSMNRAVGKGDIQNLSLKIKTVQSNTFVTNLTSISYDTTQASFDISKAGLVAGQYYKLQLAYIARDGYSTIGYYSTVGVVKYYGLIGPKIYVDGLSSKESNLFTGHCIGVFDHEADPLEKVAQYRFIITDTDGNLEYDSDWLVHNTVNDINSLLSNDEFKYNDELDQEKSYYLQYKVLTSNRMECSSLRYRILQRENVSTVLDISLKVENNFDNGYVGIQIDGDPSISLTGSFEISRQDIKNPKHWESLFIFVLQAERPLNSIWRDFTVLQGTTYRYCIRQFNEAGVYSNRVISEEIYADFEDAFLFDGQRQLKIRYNPKVSSFKNDILESKTDTIGSKYPFIFRNGYVNYKEFPISGLISYWSDEEELFVSNDKLEITDVTHFCRNETPAKDELPWNAKTTDLTNYNIAAERRFKLEALEWLTNGKPKLFRSPAEGNYIVRLLNTSLTPTDSLGRMLHTFNSTAYEVAEVNYGNLAGFGFVKSTFTEDELNRVYYRSIKIADVINGENIYTDPSTHLIELLTDPYNPTGANINALTIRFDDMSSTDIIYVNGEKRMIGGTGVYNLDNGDVINSVQIHAIPVVYYHKKEYETKLKEYNSALQLRDTYNTEISNYTTRINALTSQAEDIQADIDIMEERAATAEGIRATIAGLENQKQTATTQRNSWNTLLGYYQQRLNAENLISQAETTINTANSTKAEYEASRDNALSRASMYRQEYLNYNSMKNNLESLYQNAQSMLPSLNAQVSHYYSLIQSETNQDTINIYRAEIARLENQISYYSSVEREYQQYASNADRYYSLWRLAEDDATRYSRLAMQQDEYVRNAEIIIEQQRRVITDINTNIATDYPTESPGSRNTLTRIGQISDIIKSLGTTISNLDNQIAAEQKKLAAIESEEEIQKYIQDRTAEKAELESAIAALEVAKQNAQTLLDSLAEALIKPEEEDFYYSDSDSNYILNDYEGVFTYSYIDNYTNSFDLIAGQSLKDIACHQINSFETSENIINTLGNTRVQPLNLLQIQAELKQVENIYIIPGADPNDQYELLNEGTPITEDLLKRRFSLDKVDTLNDGDIGLLKNSLYLYQIYPVLTHDSKNNYGNHGGILFGFITNPETNPKNSGASAFIYENGREIPVDNYVRVVVSPNDELATWHAPDLMYIRKKEKTFYKIDFFSKEEFLDFIKNEKVYIKQNDEYVNYTRYDSVLTYYTYEKEFIHVTYHKNENYYTDANYYQVIKTDDGYYLDMFNPYYRFDDEDNNGYFLVYDDNTGRFKITKGYSSKIYINTGEKDAIAGVDGNLYTKFGQLVQPYLDLSVTQEFKTELIPEVTDMYIGNGILANLSYQAREVTYSVEKNNAELAAAKEEYENALREYKEMFFTVTDAERETVEFHDDEWKYDTMTEEEIQSKIDLANYLRDEAQEKYKTYIATLDKILKEYRAKSSWTEYQEVINNG